MTAINIKTPGELVSYSLRFELADIRKELGIKKSFAKLHLPDVLCGHDKNIKCQSVSPDGRWLVTGCEDSNVILWDLSTYEIKRSFNGEGMVDEVAICNDGSLIASASNQTARIWDVATGELKHLLEAKSEVYAMAFNETGDMLLSGARGSKDQVVLWDLKTGLVIKKYHGHSNSVFKVKFNSDGTKILSGGADGKLIKWDILSGNPRYLIADNGGRVDDFSISADQKYIATASKDGFIKCYDAKKGVLLRTHDADKKRVWGVGFPGDAKMLAAGGTGGFLKLYDGETGECLQASMWDHDFIGINFLSDDRLVTTTSTQSIKVWDIKQKTISKNFGLLNGAIRALCLSEDKRYLVTGGGNNKAVLWDLHEGKKIREFVGHTGVVRAVRLSRDNKYLYTGSWDSAARCYRTSTGECEKIFSGHKDWIYAIHLSFDEQFLYTSGLDGSVKIWNIKTGECEKTFGEYRNLTGMAVNDRFLAAGDGEKIVLWDMYRDDFRELKGHTKRVYTLFMHPKKPLLLSCSYDSTIRLWKLDSGACVRVFSGHTDWVTNVVADDSWKWVFSVGYDKTLRQWDIRTGECKKIYSGHRHPLHALCLDNLNNLVLTGSDDRTVKFWDIIEQKLTATLHLCEDYDLWTVEPEEDDEKMRDVFFYTERPDCLKVNEIAEDGNIIRTVQGHERDEHLKMYNRKDLVMARISNPLLHKKWKQEDKRRTYCKKLSYLTKANKKLLAG